MIRAGLSGRFAQDDSRKNGDDSRTDGDDSREFFCYVFVEVLLIIQLR